MYRIIILGPQGSGKGTQAALLSKTLALPAISAGELLRREAAAGGPTSKRIQEILNQGKMVPNEITNELISRRLERDDAKGGFILDGYPRDRAQTEALGALTPPTHVIALELTDTQAVERLAGRRVCPACGKNYHLLYSTPKYDELCDDDRTPLQVRDDDKPEAIRERLRIYHMETEPVLDLYRPRGIVHGINAAQSIEKVFEDILKALTL